MTRSIAQITEWGIEHREPDPTTGRRWRADAYLYCVEATCPECGWRVPLAPLVGDRQGTHTIARLVPDEKKSASTSRSSRVSRAAKLAAAAEAGTAKESELVCPNLPIARTPIKGIRGDGRGTSAIARACCVAGKTKTLMPREDDIFGERLYCVRWVDTWTETDANGDAGVSANGVTGSNGRRFAA